MKRTTLLVTLLSTVAAGTLGIAGGTDASAAPTLDPTVAPGGNFNLAVWQLQWATGPPASPTTIPPSRLTGAKGYSDPAYFWTDKNDGSMTFWPPEKVISAPKPKHARS